MHGRLLKTAKENWSKEGKKQKEKEGKKQKDTAIEGLR